MQTFSLMHRGVVETEMAVIQEVMLLGHLLLMMALPMAAMSDHLLLMMVSVHLAQTMETEMVIGTVAIGVELTIPLSPAISLAELTKR